MQPVILMSLTAQILKYDNCSMVPDDPEGSTAPTADAAAADVAHLDGASSVSDSASQAEAKDNVEFEQSDKFSKDTTKLSLIQLSSTAQAEAKDDDEPVLRRSIGKCLRAECI
jgi:hypothetical protein